MRKKIKMAILKDQPPQGCIVYDDRRSILIEIADTELDTIISADDLKLPSHLLPIATKYHGDEALKVWAEHEDCHISGESGSCIFCCLNV